MKKPNSHTISFSSNEVFDLQTALHKVFIMLSEGKTTYNDGDEKEDVKRHLDKADRIAAQLKEFAHDSEYFYFDSPEIINEFANFFESYRDMVEVNKAKTKSALVILYDHYSNLYEATNPMQRTASTNKIDFIIKGIWSAMSVTKEIPPYKFDKDGMIPAKDENNKIFEKHFEMYQALTKKVQNISKNQ